MSNPLAPPTRMPREKEPIDKRIQAEDKGTRREGDKGSANVRADYSPCLLVPKSPCPNSVSVAVRRVSHSSPAGLCRPRLARTRLARRLSGREIHHLLCWCSERKHPCHRNSG